jgi:hypothetical protein
MFTFLNPIALFGLIAVSIPVILHFFNRRKAHKVQFSSIRLLKLLENRRIRQVRLYQILLIIIRTLLILFLILAFARPTLPSGFISSSGSARATGVIILDNSYSMNTYHNSSSLFHEAREKLIQIIKTFRKNDQVFVLTPTLELNPWLPDLNASNLFRQFHSSKNSPDFKNVLPAAAAIFQQYPNYNREFFIISDFRIARDAMPDSLPEVFRENPVRTYLISPEAIESLNDMGIDSVFLQSSILEVNKPIELTVTLRNYNLSENAETRISLYDGDTHVAMQQVNLERGAVSEIKMSFLPRNPGLHQLRAELDDDALTDNNIWYLSLNLSAQKRILVAASVLNPALRNAFEVFTEHTSFQFEYKALNALPSVDLSAFALVILYSPELIDRIAQNLLTQYSSIGRNLIIIPDERIGVKDTNALLSLLCGHDVFREFRSATGRESYFPMDQAYFSPLLGDKNIHAAVQSDPARFYKYFRLNNAGVPLLRLANGDHLISSFKTKTHTGFVFVFNSAPGEPWNDLNTKPGFIPLLYRLISIAASEENRYSTVGIDQDFSLPLPDSAGTGPFAIEWNGSSLYEATTQQTARGQQISFSRLNQPGHYLVRDGKSIVQAFSANVSSRELRRPYFDFDTAFPGNAHLKFNEDATTQILQARTGYELWLWFLILALMMAAAELVIIRVIEGRSK